MRIIAGSASEKMLQALALCGEYPFHTIDLLECNHKWMLRTIGALRKAKYVTVQNSGENKTIRLLTNGEECIESRWEQLYNQYSLMVNGESLPGDYTHISKNHRVAEVMVMMQRAGVGVAYWEKLRLIKADGVPLHGYESTRRDAFYSSKELKRVADGEDNLLRKTRMTGAYVCCQGIYAVYNVSKGRGMIQRENEMSIRRLIRNLVISNGWHRFADSQNEISRMRTLIVGKDANAAVIIMQENQSPKGYVKSITLDNAMTTAHFIPMNDDGVEMLRILAQPDYFDVFMEMLFSKNNTEISFNRTEMSIAADAYDRANERYYLCLFDSDIKKLLKVGTSIHALRMPEEIMTIICYSWQEPIVRSVLPGAEIKSMSMQVAAQKFWAAVEVLEMEVQEGE